MAPSMWSAQAEELPDSRGRHFAVSLEGRSASFADVLRGWQNDAAFRSQFNALLAGAPYAAFRLETPPVTAETLSQPFEFVLLDSPRLAGPSDPSSVADHFDDAESGVAVFPNLGRDAVLVVPCPPDESTDYGHLAAFVRLAPESQRHALWRAVGEAMTRRVGAKPVWLSTAGYGVPWLHVRLDDRPKYYGFEPYKRAA